MTCEEADKALGADPDAAERDEGVSAHLAACPRCRAEAGALGRLEDLLHDAAQGGPRIDRGAFLAALDARIDREGRPSRPYVRLVLRLAACLAIAALAFALTRGGKERKVAQPPPSPPRLAERTPPPAPPTIEELADRLHSRDLTERKAALAALAERSDSLSRSLLASAIDDPALSEEAVALAGGTRCREALPRLCALAKDPRRGASAIAAIARIGDRAGFAFLLVLLPDGPHAGDVEEALRSNRPAAVSVLRERLQSPAPREVPSLVAAINAVTGVEFLPWLSSIARERCAAQKAALQALGRLGDPRAVASFVRAWKDPDLREAVRAALGALGAPAVRELSRLVASGERDDPLHAIALLGELRDRSAEKALQAALASPDLRVAALRALGEIGDPASAPSIAACLDDAGCRSAALASLDRVADASSVPLLVRLASSSPRPDLFRILGRVGGPQALPCLAGALGARDTAGAAMEGLVSVGEPAIPTLISTLANPALSARARTGLTRITHEDLGPDPSAWERWWKRKQSQPNGSSLFLAAL